MSQPPSRPRRARASPLTPPATAPDAVATKDVGKGIASTPRPAGIAGPALGDALASLLGPIASLAVARGLTFAAVEDRLKAAFVDAARQAQPDTAGPRIVSRVSAATGLTRREVTRLLDIAQGPPPPRPSPATQVFTRWRADPALQDRRGHPVDLPRQGEAPSFDTLARSVTQDVHPRSLLDELARLGLVRIDGETVRIVRDSVTAGADSERAYGFLGSNVGDHLRAAVANVLADAPPHVEQAVFADELSAESLVAVRALAKAQWQTLLAAAVPTLQALVDADAAAGRVRDRRVRIGLYTWNDVMSGDPSADGERASAPPPARRRKTPKE